MSDCKIPFMKKKNISTKLFTTKMTIEYSLSFKCHISINAPGGSFFYYVHKIFRKTRNSNPLIRTYVYLVIRIAGFMENFA